MPGFLKVGLFGSLRRISRSRKRAGRLREGRPRTVDACYGSTGSLGSGSRIFPTADHARFFSSTSGGSAATTVVAAFWPQPSTRTAILISPSYNNDRRRHCAH
jgi:hypothetical protein